MENATKTTLTNVAGQVAHALNNTAAQFATHSTAIGTSGLPVAAAFWVYARTLVWIKERIIKSKIRNQACSRGGVYEVPWDEPAQTCRLKYSPQN